MNSAPPLLPDTAIVAFYGAEIGPSNLLAYYDTLVGWLGKIVSPINELAVHRADKFGRYRPFDSADARLRAAGFGDVTGFSIRAVPTTGVEALWNYWAEADVSVQDGYALVGTNTSVARLSDGSLLNIARLIIEQLTPKYGAGFVRPRETSPSLYAIGGTLSTVSEMMNDRDAAMTASRWGMEGMTVGVRQSLLRDIYEWNFVTAGHLETLVEAKPLKEWIEEDPTRGTVEPVGGRMWLWRVDPSEARLIYRAIDKAGLIYHCSW